MQWKEGRQGTGYFNKLLLQGKTWDCYLLKYPEGSFIPKHTDPVEDNKEHHRINFTFWRAKSGGQFVLHDRGLKILGHQRFAHFRPDIEPHSVRRVNEGTRYVLSIGWVKNGNN
jgi:Rps23 Pro-64 3,4-dihydroxylase Tpa1-like proline 4-hydroxylase